ncbi:cytochrome-c oxidase [Jannaschia rubra]|uniref:cytochrome-c oxidase n=1 Tax=Jannaschia rubra TaxID=282197 RepID=UPI0011873F41|nr:cytochrome-c oxidase [Jannaschia rubra]
MLLAVLSVSTPALADHPGDRLDEAMAAKEPDFEQAERHPPAIKLRTVDGAEFDLRDLEDKVVVLSFLPQECGTPCADQQALLAEVQEAVNVTPMREMVSFVTVASSGSPVAPGRDDANWLGLTPREEGAVAELGAEWAELSRRGEEGPMAYVLGRGARSAGIFHGADFDRINMVLYVNGLTNAHPPEPGLFDRIRRLFQ